MLVRRERRSALRLKLRKSWYYERNQPSGGELADFGPRIDFSAGPFNQQLGPGWYWHEGSQGRKKGALGYRWTRKEALCYLESRDSGAIHPHNRVLSLGKPHGDLDRRHPGR